MELIVDIFLLLKIIYAIVKTVLLKVTTDLIWHQMCFMLVLQDLSAALLCQSVLMMSFTFHL